MGVPERRTGSKATPVVWKDEVIIHRRGEIVGFDVSTGLRKWWVKGNTQGVGTPVVSPDALYIGEWFNCGEPELRVPLPDFTTLVTQYDKNGDAVFSGEEFPQRFLQTRRAGLEGVTGADNMISGKTSFNWRMETTMGRLAGKSGSNI